MERVDLEQEHNTLNRAEDFVWRLDCVGWFRSLWSPIPEPKSRKSGLSEKTLGAAAGQQLPRHPVNRRTTVAQRRRSWRQAGCLFSCPLCSFAVREKLVSVASFPPVTLWVSLCLHQTRRQPEPGPLICFCACERWPVRKNCSFLSATCWWFHVGNLCLNDICWLWLEAIKEENRKLERHLYTTNQKPQAVQSYGSCQDGLLLSFELHVCMCQNDLNRCWFGYK